MSALQKLQALENYVKQLVLEHSNNSGTSSKKCIDIEQLDEIRKSLSELSHDLEEERKFSSQYQYHQSYRTRASLMQSHPSSKANHSKSYSPHHPRAHPTISEEKTVDTNSTDTPVVDDETLDWLDANYGAAMSSTVSTSAPQRSPLQKFKFLGRILTDEIKQCHKFGFEPSKIQSPHSGWARMSMCGMSAPLTMARLILVLPAVETALSNVWNPEQFDIFAFAELSEVRGHVLLALGSFLAQQFRWLTAYHIALDKFHNFLMAIEKKYNAVPYHNQIHGVDVAHTMAYFCRTKLFEKHMSDLDLMAAFIAAIIHDVGHTGETNNYHINAASTLAVRYNDRSVLENFHLATAFETLRDGNCNFLDNLTKTEYKYVRDTVICMVLGTDLYFHQKQLTKMQQFASIIARENKLELKIFDTTQQSHNAHDTASGPVMPRIRGEFNEKRFIMEVALHLSDISNPTKKRSVCIEWTKRITQEFFNQGDKERLLELPISPGCDRNAHSNMAKQSLAFIDFIVAPMYNAYFSIDPEIATLVDSIQRNRDYWKSQV